MSSFFTKLHGQKAVINELISCGSSYKYRYMYCTYQQNLNVVVYMPCGIDRSSVASIAFLDPKLEATWACRHDIIVNCTVHTIPSTTKVTSMRFARIDLFCSTAHSILLSSHFSPLSILIGVYILRM